MSASLQIESGLAEGQVLQRRGRKGGQFVLVGRAHGTKALDVSILRRGRALSGWKKQKVRVSRDGRFRLVVKAIPAGGPYDLRLSSGSVSVTVSSWFVGDVWILAGQSNMQGCGLLSEAAPPHPLVKALLLNRQWAPSREPIHVPGESDDEVHHRNGLRGLAARAFSLKRGRGTGLGVFFGREMVKRTGVPQGLICTALGGTSMSEWSPALRSRNGKSLYASMLKSVQCTGQPVAGLLWYQGESDTSEAEAPQYTQRMKKLVTATRRDLRQPRLPWLMVQLGRCLGRPDAPWNAIREMQLQLPKVIPHLQVVGALDLPLADQIHVRAWGGLDRLGVRLARLADRSYGGNRSELPPPEFARIARYPGALKGACILEVSFKNVVGALRHCDDPSGFQLHDEYGQARPLIYRTRVAGNRVLLDVSQAPLNFYLSYGLGTNPVAHLCDDRDMPVPAFGPVPLAPPVRATPYLTRWRISPTEPSAQPLDRRPLPDLSRLATVERSFENDIGFVDLHEEWAHSFGLTYFQSGITCPAAMTLNFHVGYDAPFRLWIGGKPVFTDMQGTNPCIPDDQSGTVHLPAGRHDIVVGMDSSGGMAWGFFLRFSRDTAKGPLPCESVGS